MRLRGRDAGCSPPWERTRQDSAVLMCCKRTASARSSTSAGLDIGQSWLSRPGSCPLEASPFFTEPLLLLNVFHLPQHYWKERMGEVDFPSPPKKRQDLPLSPIDQVYLWVLNILWVEKTEALRLEDWGWILVHTKNRYPWEYLTSVSLSSLICEMTP